MAKAASLARRFGVVVDGARQMGGDLAADADGLGELGDDLVDQGGDLFLEQADLVVQVKGSADRST